METARVSPQHARQVFEQLGIILDGHFVSEQGLHMWRCLNMAALISHPNELNKLAGGLAWLLRHCGVGWIVSPAIAGVGVGNYTAQHLGTGVRFAYVERNHKDNELVLPPAYREPIHGQYVAVVDDFTASGSTIIETIELLEKCQARIAAAAVICDRNHGEAARALGAEGFKRRFLMRLLTLDSKDIARFTPKECAKYGPCAQKIPIHRRPGYGYNLEKEQPDHPCAFID